MKFYSHGKLLLAGEYLVLDGALSLALPCKKGQYLEVIDNNESHLKWTSWDVTKKIWFKSVFSIEDLTILETTNIDFSKRLKRILKVAKKMTPYFLKNGAVVNTYLEFNKNWGLGSSSTLINNISQWAKIDPYKLLENTFGGSGYDIACASVKKSIFYKKKPKRFIQEAYFDPPFKNNLFFVYLNQKQNTYQEINKYNVLEKNFGIDIDKINAIIKRIPLALVQSEFNELLENCENIVSKHIQKKVIKKVLFNDFEGTIKSLGAWGGDFILASGNASTPSYFKKKGYKNIIPYSEMVY